MVRQTGTPHERLSRLIAAEAVLAGSDCSSAAKQYAHSVLREAINPLEAINNLVYIAKQSSDNSETLRIYIEMMEEQLERLNEVVRRSLLFSTSSSG